MLNIFHIVENKIETLERTMKELPHLINQRNINGDTLMHFCKDYDIETIKIILKYKPNLNILNYDRLSPLHKLRELSDEKIVLLVKHKANIHLKGAKGETPLTLAYKINKALLLLENGSDPLEE